MSRQTEFKKRYDPEMGKYTRQHIYGEGVITDTLKSLGKKVFGKTVKSAFKKGAEKALTNVATKTGDYAGKKAGDKIVSLLSKEKPPIKSKSKTTSKKVSFNQDVKIFPKKSTQQKNNARVNSILSGGKII